MGKRQGEEGNNDSVRPYQRDLAWRETWKFVADACSRENRTLHSITPEDNGKCALNTNSHTERRKKKKQALSRFSQQTLQCVPRLSQQKAKEKRNKNKILTVEDCFPLVLLNKDTIKDKRSGNTFVKTGDYNDFQLELCQ